MAHTHGDNRSVKLAVGFYETGKADRFAITKEIFRDTVSGGC